MSLVRKYLRLAPDERRLVCEAAATTAVVRVALWLLPFRVIQGRATRQPVEPGRPASLAQRAIIPRAVVRASRMIPKATCLTQALACQRMFARRGIVSELHIGVNNSEARFDAHAWVTCGDDVVLGERPDKNYTPILSWGVQRL